MTGITKLLIFAALIVSFSQIAAAQTINAASCSSSDVQAALNSVTSSTKIVSIPAGTCVWTSELSFTVPSGNSNLSIIGAGSLSTTGGGDATIIVDGVGGTDAVFNIGTGNASSFFRLAGITFKGGSGSSKNHGFVAIYGSSQNFRVDHTHFDATTATSSPSSVLTIGDWQYGVVDHSIFDLSDGSEINGIVIQDASFGNLGPEGDGSWAAPTGLGGNTYIYAEDDVFNGGVANDCQHGGRFVIRYDVLNNSAIQTHPTGGAGRARGCRAWEFYKNTLNTSNSTPLFNGFFLSSGTGVVWGNSAPAGYEHFMTIHSMRRDNTTYPESPTPNGWGYCGTSFNGTGSNWDLSSTTSSGGRCLDQPGEGIGQLITGEFPTAIDSVTGVIGWSNQALEPVYEWSDTWSPVPGYPVIFLANYNSDVLVNNSNYYLQCSPSSTTGCTSTFDGTQGTGSGVLSGRPSSCVPGVAYWATDQNTLYQCQAGNTWAAYYTPYTYPHPLVAASQTSGNLPTAPTNLTAAVE